MRVIVAFDGVVDGAIHPRHFAVGEEVEGQLAAVALANGWAEQMDEKPKSIAAMTLEELKAYAAANSIDLGTATKKDDVRAAIEKAEAALAIDNLPEEDLKALAVERGIDLTGAADLAAMRERVKAVKA